MTQTRARTAAQGGVPWLSDGWEAYTTTIPELYLDGHPIPTVPAGRAVRLQYAPGVAHTQVIKHRQGRRLARVEVRANLGPVATQPHTVHIERLNGTLRDRLACVTRKTHAFAKQVATWEAVVGLSLFEHNWCRPHVALRQPCAITDTGRRYDPVTPAMHLGLATTPLPWLDFLTQPLTHYLRG